MKTSPTHAAGRTAGSGGRGDGGIAGGGAKAGNHASSGKHDAGDFGFGDLGIGDPAPDAATAMQPAPLVARDWSCEPALASDDICDCGCGSGDPRCANDGCTSPGCYADGCAVCHDADGRPAPCAGSFSCDAARYADGTQCDCGCGAPDPDCDGMGCDAPGCDAPACAVRHDAAGQAIRPNAWSCDAARFGAEDGCDCGCGAIDPDCVVGCSEPGCRAPGCDSCRAADGSAFECRWSCELSRFADGKRCDCGCGTPDPDCDDVGCDEPGCYALACDSCSGSSGELPCERGRCDASVFGDGVCDCGCRDRDPDCGGSLACLEPGCSADGCERCHDDQGGERTCSDWVCGFEGHGAGDGCNCGCGAIDPDCGAGLGCAAPGCRADGCVSCRDAEGAPASCSE